ncbi:GNAT family N-acetyltransferase [Amycolatopsis thermophila]|uniref:GNAT superfamily N-acetyltransferase n=1 Tax=Amycolatopsis thermophila TaxID=206084 RepID=A0ABU0EU47_9PSEU|nr:GNAT family N-acetyltransferase [Amycolatopsis thermophila]MDQ0378793.1 GNAT superfamily N-acetyltransferase [Amycolatopsis thermophila]
MLGRVEETVTHVEMTSPDDLCPAAPVPGVTLENVPADSPLIRPTTLRIGERYHWPSTTWSEAEWAEYLARPGRACVLIRYATEVAGLADFQCYALGSVEITTFGVVPEYVGKGIGGYALTLAVTEAWNLAPTVRRVWLHTSTLDHPHALPNYQRRGFRTFRTTTGER